MGLRVLPIGFITPVCRVGGRPVRIEHISFYEEPALSDVSLPPGAQPASEYTVIIAASEQTCARLRRRKKPTTVEWIVCGSLRYRGFSCLPRPLAEPEAWHHPLRMERDKRLVVYDVKGSMWAGKHTHFIFEEVSA